MNIYIMYVATLLLLLLLLLQACGLHNHIQTPRYNHACKRERYLAASSNITHWVTDV